MTCRSTCSRLVGHVPVSLRTHGAGLRSGVILSLQRPGNRNVGRAAVIVVEVGAAVGLGRMFVLGLERCCRDVRLVGVGTFLGRHGVIDSTRAAAIRDMVVVNDGGVVNNRLVAIYRIAAPSAANTYVHNRGVIGKGSAAPHAARKTDTHVAEAVVDSAVVADVTTPVTGMKNVKAATPAPVARSPESADIGSRHPGAGNPVVAVRAVGPVAGSPHEAGLWANRLNIDG